MPVIIANTAHRVEGDRPPLRGTAALGPGTWTFHDRAGRHPSLLAPVPPAAGDRGRLHPLTRSPASAAASGGG
ncbi:hypothetical protein, partial [Actinoallomurus acaciae]